MAGRSRPQSAPLSSLGIGPPAFDASDVESLYQKLLVKYRGSSSVSSHPPFAAHWHPPLQTCMANIGTQRRDLQPASPDCLRQWRSSTPVLFCQIAFASASIAQRGSLLQIPVAPLVADIDRGLVFEALGRQAKNKIPLILSFLQEIKSFVRTRPKAQRAEGIDLKVIATHPHSAVDQFFLYKWSWLTRRKI